MTTPEERRSAIDCAYKFLGDLADGSIKRIPKAVRREAYSIFRHFPRSVEIDYFWKEDGK